MDNAERFRGKYRIPSARWQNWDYGWDGAYFITIVTKNRIHYFGAVRDGIVWLSDIGKIAEKYWYEIPNHFSFVRLDEFVVMPNHIHGILIIDKKSQNDDVIVETGHDLSLRLDKRLERPDKKSDGDNLTPGQKRFRNPGRGTVSTIIGLYKSTVSKFAHKINHEFAWQSRFHDHVIRNANELNRIRYYIRNNPMKWKDDDLY